MAIGIFILTALAPDIMTIVSQTRRLAESLENTPPRTPTRRACPGELPCRLDAPARILLLVIGTISGSIASNYGTTAVLGTEDSITPAGCN
jgi:hypothetical protein